ncbi:MAG: DNA primase [Candidatus Krumholzibacteria bacterium]|nr:DNA primase [Candidatus Krumholzibacteria bacterium]
MQIPQDTINEIRERADIVEIVSRFVDLKRAGVNYKALCPFHEEKTPSFVVSPDKQIFHCFGCGRGGNIFSFLMEIEGVSFPEAVRELGKHYGIEVPSRPQPTDGSSQNESLYRVCDFAARWYHRQLVDKTTGGPTQRYLLDRGIPEEAWATFQLGYAGEGWDQFWQAARRRDVPIDVMTRVKLVVSSDKSTGYYDYFRQRLMFPIALLSGRVVAFGARTLDDGGQPKYLNSPESPIYAKRRILYGLHVARPAIRSERRAILVEGYTDCIALHLGGFQNTVASCGTAITAEHAGLLRRLTREVILMPDADPAGMDSALSSGSIFLAAGLDVRVVVLKAGLDPDSAIRLDRDKFAKNVGGALEYFAYLSYIMKDRAMSPRDKETLIQRVITGLGSSGDKLRYEVLAQEASKVLGIDPESLPKWRGPRGIQDAGRTDEVRRAEVPKRTRLEKMLLRLILESAPEAAAALDKLDPDDFSQDDCREFYKLLDSAWENHIDIRSKTFQQKAESAGLEGLAAEISLIPIPPGNPGILLKDTVRRVKELQIRDELNMLSEKLRILPEDSDEAIAVAKQFEMLKQALMEL